MLSKSAEFRSYIPFIYLAWVDNTLSPAEWHVIRPYIKKDEKLTASEKENLYEFLNPDRAPAISYFEEWKDWMEESGIKIDPKDAYPLSTFAQAISGIEDIENHKAIEKNLDLRPALYKHALPFKREQGIGLSVAEKEEIKGYFISHSKLENGKIDEFLSKDEFRWTLERNKENLRARVLEQVLMLGDAGYGSIAYPEEYGGINDIASYGYIFEKLIAVDPSLAVRFGVQFGLFGGAVASLGTKKHHDKWLRAIGCGEILGCFAMTEKGHGSNVRHLQTRASYDKASDSFIINTPSEGDCKEYIGNALTARLAVVFAQLIANGENYGIHAFVVPVRDEQGNLLSGIRVEDDGYKLGLNGVDNGKIWFDEVRIPRFNLLDRFGKINDSGEYESPIESEGRRFFTMLGTLIGGRICVGKGALKGAQYSLHLAIEYALRRRQFGPSNQQNEELLIDYPSHQLRLIPGLARSLTLHTAFEDVMEQFSHAEAGSTKEIEAEVAALKAAATWFADRTNQECREACGGEGFMYRNRVGDMKLDLDVFTTFEGDNTVLIQLAAKGVLSKFQEQFSSGDFTSVVRYFGMQFKSTITGLNPLYKGKTDKAHLRDPRFHLHALSYRLEELQMDLSKRLRALIQRKVDSYEAFLRVQNHVITVGKAYADFLEMDKFYKRTLSSLDGKSENTRKIISYLAGLSALSLIYEHRGWYLEKSYINAAKSKAIRNQIEQLCLDLRPYLPDLIHCFDIPKSAIRYVG